VEILEWWNLIFLLPAFAAVLYVLLLAIGVMPFDDIGLDVDAPDDGDGLDLLGVLGLGRVPLSLTLVCFGLLWGIIGLFAVRFLSAIWTAPNVFIWPALAIALLGSFLLTAVLGRMLSPLMPRTESYGAAAAELVGRLAETRYAVSAAGGSVQVYDQHGTLHEVSARVLPGEPAIPAGTRVVLWRYDAAAGSYLVTQDDAFNGLPAA
jgi:hypothetical protein